MYLLSISQLDTGHLKEICDDIQWQVESGIVTESMFSMTLVPEGNPLSDKAAEMGTRFGKFREELAKRGLKAGILMQSTIGHGYILNEQNPFQNYVSLTDGKERQTCCPYDDGLRKHFVQVCKRLASFKPSSIMLDDDFRLSSKLGKGCACPRHLAEINRCLGLSLDREQLLAHLQGASELDRKVGAAFEESQLDSLLGMVRAMRAAVDEVDPLIQGSLCICSGDVFFAEPIARAFAGEGNPVIIRLNNGCYASPGPRYLPGSMWRAANQLSVLRGKVDVVIAETDTCPQNRYSTGARSLHSHLTGDLLEGCDGAKHWITRLRGYEPESGRAYRDVLALYNKFHRALYKMVKEVKYAGCRIPIAENPVFRWNPPIEEDNTGNWGMQLLDRYGIPLYFSKESGGAAFLAGTEVEKFRDDELEKLFKGALFLDVEAARRLQARNFGEFLGVKVKPWSLPRATGEMLNSGELMPAPEKVAELEPFNDQVRADSKLYHAPYNQSPKHELLTPGVTVFANPAGGSSVVFAGVVPSGSRAGVSFLNQTRKKQIVRLVNAVEPLDLWYPGDAEIFLRAGRFADGKIFVAFFNIGTDPLDYLPLMVKTVPHQVEQLTPDGKWLPVTLQTQGNLCLLGVRVETLLPVILRLA